MRLAAVVQHHPDRQPLLGRLTDGLQMPWHVVTDAAEGLPSPWRGYQHCLSHALEMDASHVLIVQDDAIPCFDFECWLECRIKQEPKAALVLFLAAQPKPTARNAQIALSQGASFASLEARDFMPAVAVLWPKALLESVIGWTFQYRGRHSRSDDHMLGQWHRDTHSRVLVTVPSLVQHPDDVPSLIGNGNGANGRNPSRVALLWDG